MVVALIAGLGLLRGTAFWSTSDGVYAMTARELVHGKELYEEVAAAQPPPVYLAGAGLLAVHDSLTSLRTGLALPALATALLVGLAVLRLTGRRGPAVLAALLAPLTPLMLHENALLTPETLGTPLLLGCALLAARSGCGGAAGLAGAACVATKLSFALPVLLVLLVGCERRRSLVWSASALAALAAAATAAFGADLWKSVIAAQAQTGVTGARDALGQLSQIAWNELPLVLPAGVALVLGGARARDQALLRTLTAAAVGGLALGLSVVKVGSYVNTAQVAEPPLLALAICGLAWAFTPPVRRRVLAGATAIALLLLLAQSAALLISPADPVVYTRPGATSGPRRLLSERQVAAAAAAARRCDASAAYPGIPFVAFVANRRVPGDQPDTFIITVPQNQRFADLAHADPRVCRGAFPVVDARGDVRLATFGG